MKWLFRLIPHFHKWIHPLEKDEEEHGRNTTKRVCKLCGREQWLLFSRWKECYWQDSPGEKIKHLRIK